MLYILNAICISKEFCQEAQLLQRDRATLSLLKFCEWLDIKILKFIKE